MSLSFTMTYDSTTLTFGGLASTSTTPRQAIDFDAGAAHQQQFRFKAPGVTGQFLVRAEQTGRLITAVVRYLSDTMATAEANYQADCAALVTKQVSIACNGQTYQGCNVIPQSIRRSRPIKPVGRAVTAAVYFDVSMQFTQDNPSGA